MSSSENENNLNCVGQSTDKSKANNCVNEMKIMEKKTTKKNNDQAKVKETMKQLKNQN